jgi:hypothetical protein
VGEYASISGQAFTSIWPLKQPGPSNSRSLYRARYTFQGEGVCTSKYHSLELVSLRSGRMLGGDVNSKLH